MGSAGGWVVVAVVEARFKNNGLSLLSHCRSWDLRRVYAIVHCLACGRVETTWMVLSLGPRRDVDSPRVCHGLAPFPAPRWWWNNIGGKAHRGRGTRHHTRRRRRKTRLGKTLRTHGRGLGWAGPGNNRSPSTRGPHRRSKTRSYRPRWHGSRWDCPWWWRDQGIN